MAYRYLVDKKVSGKLRVSPDGNSWSPYLTGNDYYPKLLFKSNGNTALVKTKFDVVFEAEFSNLQLDGQDRMLESPVNGWGVSFENLVVTIDGKKRVYGFRSINPQENLTLADNFYRLADVIDLKAFVVATKDDKLQSLRDSWKY